MELPVAPPEVERDLDRVAGRPRAFVHDEAVALEEAVGERRLSHVRSAYEADADGPPLTVGPSRAFAIRRGRVLQAPDPVEDCLSQIGLAAAVFGGHADRLAQSQASDPFEVGLL